MFGIGVLIKGAWSKFKHAFFFNNDLLVTCHVHVFCFFGNPHEYMAKLEAELWDNNHLSHAATSQSCHGDPCRGRRGHDGGGLRPGRGGTGDGCDVLGGPARPVSQRPKKPRTICWGLVRVMNGYVERAGTRLRGVAWVAECIDFRSSWSTLY